MRRSVMDRRGVPDRRENPAMDCRPSRPGVPEPTPTDTSQSLDASGALLTVRQLSARHPAFSEPALRWAVFCTKARPGTREHAVYAGLQPAIVRLGRRVLIDEQRFLEWLRGSGR